MWNMLINSIKALTFLTIILSSFSAWAAPALVKYQTGFGYPKTQIQINFTNVQQGSLLIVAVRLSTTGTSTVTSPGMVWTRDLHQAHKVGLSLDIHSSPNVSAGSHTLTINVSGGSTAIRAIALEYSGVATSSPTIDTASNASTSGAVIAGVVTTGINDTLLFAAAGTDSDNQGWVASSGYTIRNKCNAELEPDQKLCTEDRGPVTSGIYSHNFTINSDTWVAGLVAYAPSGAQSPISNKPSPPNNLRVLSQ